MISYDFLIKEGMNYALMRSVGLFLNLLQTHLNSSCSILPTVSSHQR